MEDNPSRPKVLIVDDVPANIKIVGEAIREQYEIAIATNGQKALEIASQVPHPDLILLDIIMPDLDGYEVIRRLKGNKATADIPIIFITSKSEVDDEKRGFEVGVVDYIIKPFSLPVVQARVKTHLALKQQRDELRTLNETKNRFLGTAAHDLRNPLAAIRGLAELLKEAEVGEINDDQKEMLEMMFDTSDHMLALVNDLLDVAVIESGKFDIKFTEGDLAGIISDRLRILRPAVNKKHMKVVREMDDVPKMSFDANRILQVFDNLFSNAVKFSPPGSTITIRLRQADDRVLLEIIDDGPGISDEDQKHLFGDFQRIGNKPTGGESSTGLGLSIVKRVMHAHGGDVEVQSKVGKGTTMMVWFPLQVTSVLNA